jgi:hypothetical protein
MNEQQARQRLKQILDGLYEEHINYSEANLNTSTGKKGFIEFHLDKLLQGCGGIWDESKAEQYILSLESELHSN